MDDLETKIRRGQVAAVYVLSGEMFLVARILEVLRNQVVPAGARAFNYDVFAAKGADIKNILGIAATLPMLGKYRLVVVREAETLGAKGLEELMPYLEKPCPSTVMVLVCAKADGRLKFFALAKRKGFFQELTAPRQLASWVEAEARHVGAKCGSDAARRLVEVVGRDLGQLARAIEELSLYVGAGRAISADDVDELIAETRERTVFELANAVGNGNRELAYKAVARLFEQRESAVGVAMMLARHLRQVAMAKELSGKGMSSRELPGLLGVPPFAIEGLIAQARRMPAHSVERAFELLGQADRDLKGSIKAALGERVVVERLVGDLIALQGVV